MIAELAAVGVTAPVVLGGIIPESDRSNLLATGVTTIYTPKDFDIARIMRDIAEIAAKYRKSQK